jgi:beta-galactosidase
VPVFVYTNGDCAELFLNGMSQGKKCKNPTSPNPIERTRLMWHDVVYQPGELRAVAYREGAVLGEATVKTTGAPYEIRLTPDRTTIAADGMDLSYILVEAFDRNGDAQPLSDARVSLSISGPASIAGVGNGNPQSMEPFQADYVDLFYSKAMVIVRAGREAGQVTVTARAAGLGGATTVIRVRQ